MMNWWSGSRLGLLFGAEAWYLPFAPLKHRYPVLKGNFWWNRLSSIAQQSLSGFFQLLQLLAAYFGIVYLP